MNNLHEPLIFQADKEESPATLQTKWKLIVYHQNVYCKKEICVKNHFFYL